MSFMYSVIIFSVGACVGFMACALICGPKWINDD